MIKNTLINCGGRLLDLSSPKVMGIMNLTPDSFYAGSRIQTEKEAIIRAENILNEGGTIIDLGAYSSRPGAEHISFDEEFARLRQAMEAVCRHFPQTFISIDTFRAEIVRRLYDEFGAFIVNDISAGEFDHEMIPEVARLKLPYIAMHMRGTPQTMQLYTEYGNIGDELTQYFVTKVEALRKAGIIDLIIDPGFGFAKTIENNYQLLAQLADLRLAGCPILVGMSRKSMFYKPLETTADKVLAATIAANTIALQNGADILRVHDVKEATQTIAVWRWSQDCKKEPRLQEPRMQESGLQEPRIRTATQAGLII